MAILTGVIRGKVISGGAIVGSIVTPFIRGLRAFLKLTHLAKLSSFGDKILENDSTVPKTIVDNNGIVQETTIGETRILNARRYTSLLINTDSPIYTNVTLPVGDYILSVKGTGTVTLTGQASGSVTPSANRKQLLFSVATAGDVVFDPVGTFEHWQLEQDFGTGVASEYRVGNVIQNGLFTLGVRGETPIQPVIVLSASPPSYKWVTSDDSEYIDTLNPAHTFSGVLNAISLEGVGLDGYLTEIQIPLDSFVGNIPDISTFTALTSVYFHTNDFDGDIPSLTANTALTQAYFQNCCLTGYTASTISTTLTIFNANGNKLPVTAINQILIDFDTAGHSTGTLDLGGANNAAPTGAGITAKTSLQGNGWTVTTN